jgi:hypothetical protein
MFNKSPPPTNSGQGNIGALVARFERDLRAEVVDDGAVVRFGTAEFSAAQILRRVDPLAFQDQMEEWRDEIWVPQRREVLERIYATDAMNRKRFEALVLAVKANRVIPL